MKHICHAIGCNEAVPPKLLMCAYHWRKVPPLLKANVFRYYRTGQEIDKNPSPEYIEAAKQAIESVKDK